MAKIKITPSSQFKRDLKKNYELLISPRWAEVFKLLCENKELPEMYVNHPLKGDYHGYWECHVLPDLLLIYQRKDNELILVRLGSHSELFG